MWRQPTDMGCECLGYSVRYYDGETYGNSDESVVYNKQFDNTDMCFMIYDGECPTDKAFYADVCKLYTFNHACC